MKNVPRDFRTARKPQLFWLKEDAFLFMLSTTKHSPLINETKEELLGIRALENESEDWFVVQSPSGQTCYDYDYDYD